MTTRRRLAGRPWPAGSRRGFLVAAQYEAYLDQIHAWADSLGVNPETVSTSSSRPRQMPAVANGPPAAEGDRPAARDEERREDLDDDPDRAQPTVELEPPDRATDPFVFGLGI